jgi:hypothetical protein
LHSDLVPVRLGSKKVDVFNVFNVFVFFGHRQSRELEELAKLVAFMFERELGVGRF